MLHLSLDKNNRRALTSAIVASGTDDLNVMFLSFSMASIIKELSISSAQAGWIATITNLGMLLGGLVFGVLADRYNKFKVFKWTIVIFAVATGLIYFTTSLPYLYIMRFIAGIGVGGEYGVAIAIMASIVPKEKNGTDFFAKWDCWSSWFHHIGPTSRLVSTNIGLERFISLWISTTLVGPLDAICN